MWATPYLQTCRHVLRRSNYAPLVYALESVPPHEQVFVAGVIDRHLDVIRINRQIAHAEREMAHAERAYMQQVRAALPVRLRDLQPAFRTQLLAQCVIVACELWRVLALPSVRATLRDIAPLTVAQWALPLRELDGLRIQPAVA